MTQKFIADLETAINEIEEKLDDDQDEDFVTSEQFEEMYTKLKELEERTNEEIESLPYENASEKMFHQFDAFGKSFKKCQKRIKRIEDDTDINDGNDSSWMFDEDEN